MKISELKRREGFFSRSSCFAASGLTAVMLIATQAVADGGRVTASSATMELRRACRSDGESLSAEHRPDPREIVARHDRALAACNTLIDGAGLSGGELAAVLLDRADLMAPGQGAAYARALSDYDRAIALQPTAATAFARRGKAHLLYMRNLERALRDLDTAIRLDPSQADFFVTRASIRASLGNPGGALADLDHAIALSSAFEKAWTLRGLTHFNNGNTGRAITDFDEAIRLAPDSDANYLFRGSARRAAGDEAGAQADQAKADELSSREAAPR